MKLNEFTDRLYAMGGIEQEEKRSRRLNEDISSEEKAMKKARAKRAARKDESLNESAYDMRDGDLRDEFYSLIDGMDPAEIVDMMYWYLDDYALEDMIKDIKGTDASDLDEAVDFAKDDLKQDFLALCKEHNLDKDTAIEALLSMLGKHAMKVLMLNLKKHFDK